MKKNNLNKNKRDSFTVLVSLIIVAFIGVMKSKAFVEQPINRCKSDHDTVVIAENVCFLCLVLCALSYVSSRWYACSKRPAISHIHVCDDLFSLLRAMKYILV